MRYLYTPVIQSKNKECVLLHTFYTLYIDNFDMRVSEAVRKVNKEIFNNATGINEITTAFGISRDSIDLYNYQTIMVGKEARNMPNADSVFFYDILLDKPYKDKYTYCERMVISKRSRPAFLIK